MTMPLPPTRFTSDDLSTRSTTPRSQTTILPVALAWLRVSGANTASVLAAEARLTDRAVTSRAWADLAKRGGADSRVLLAIAEHDRPSVLGDCGAGGHGCQPWSDVVQG